jgi:hypothetical protein
MSSDFERRETIKDVNGDQSGEAPAQVKEGRIARFVIGILLGVLISAPLAMADESFWLPCYAALPLAIGLAAAIWGDRFWARFLRWLSFLGSL